MEAVVYKNLKTPRLYNIDVYRSLGGYKTLKRVLSEMAPEEIIGTLKESKLRGRGGAGFPAWLKWESVRAAQEKSKYIVCNADEGEPGTFKDKPVLEGNPHLILEAMAIAANAVNAKEGIIYLRYEYPKAYARLASALAEAKQRKKLGNFKIYLRRGAGSYVCGEETALLNSLEGTRGIAREKPPFPSTDGLMGKPTLVHNVETLACIPQILEKGAEWFCSLGLNGQAGSKVYSLSGDIKKAGNYELPLGTSARELIFTHGKGTKHKNRPIKAFGVGGISGGILPASKIDVALDYDTLSREGLALGSGAVIVFDSSRCIVQIAKEIINFFASESCGKCFPCRLGTYTLKEMFKEIVQGGGSAKHFGEIEVIAQVLLKTSSCGLGVGAGTAIQSIVRYFNEELRSHIFEKRCPSGACRFARGNRR